MEEAQIEETLEDRFARFRTEVKKLNRKPEGLQKQLDLKLEKLERLRTARLANLALGETEKAETLNNQLEPLAEEVEVLAAQISAFGQSAQTIISNAPGSELFDLAAGIVDEAADICPQLEPVRNCVNSDKLVQASINSDTDKKLGEWSSMGLEISGQKTRNFVH